MLSRGRDSARRRGPRAHQGEFSLRPRGLSTSRPEPPATGTAAASMRAYLGGGGQAHGCVASAAACLRLLHTETSRPSAASSSRCSWYHGPCGGGQGPASADVAAHTVTASAGRRDAAHRQPQQSWPTSRLGRIPCCDSESSRAEVRRRRRPGPPAGRARPGSTAGRPGCPGHPLPGTRSGRSCRPSACSGQVARLGQHHRDDLAGAALAIEPGISSGCRWAWWASSIAWSRSPACHAATLRQGQRHRLRRRATGLAE